MRLRHAGTRSVTPKQHVHEEQIGPPVSWLHVDSLGIIAGASWFGSLDAADLKHTLIDICLMLIIYIDSIIINNGVHNDDNAALLKSNAQFFTYCGFIWICLQQCFIEMIEWKGKKGQSESNKWCHVLSEVESGKRRGSKRTEPWCIKVEITAKWAPRVCEGNERNYARNERAHAREGKRRNVSQMESFLEKLNKLW